MQNGMEKGKMPLEWRKAIIVPLHKRGSKDKCQNYQGIRSVPGKVYAKMMNERMKRRIKARIMKFQRRKVQGGSEKEDAVLIKFSP